MGVRETAVRQYQAIVDHAAERVSGGQPQFVPAEGWIATVRKALCMSGAEFARRLGVTRARVSEMERTEPDGSVTLRTMDAAAKAMGCRFVYAIVPKNGNVQDAIEAQAHRKARAIVNRASDHMALEQQSLSVERNAEEVERIARDLMYRMPSDFWRKS